MKYIFITFFFVCFTYSQAQPPKKINYKKYPYWIEMMKDPNVNYFEAVKAYDTFWKNKHKPLEEDEVIGQTKGEASKEEKMDSRREMREKRREKELFKKYGLDCKKFEHWKSQVKPYVQPDGHILSKDEQFKLWEQK